MTINDIEKSALALMFTNYEEDLSEQDVDLLESEEYRKYTVNMRACINRALMRIQRAEVLPLQSFTIDASTTCLNDGHRARYNLQTLIPNLYSIERVAFDSACAYEPSESFHVEAGILVLIPLRDGEKHIVIYEPKVQRIALNALSSTNIDIPDEIAEIIPYFIKAELYEEDEPSLAAQARNIFEATLESLKRNDYAAQASVVNVFGSMTDAL